MLVVSFAYTPVYIARRLDAQRPLGTAGGGRSGPGRFSSRMPPRVFQNGDRRCVSPINDLSAVITASDPSEGRTELFGTQALRRRRVSQFGGREPKATSKDWIEIRQARPKSARKLFRQRVIGMLLIFGGTAYLVHVTNSVPRRPLGRNARQDLTMFLRDIESVERVEQNEVVTL